MPRSFCGGGGERRFCCGLWSCVTRRLGNGEPQRGLGPRRTNRDKKYGPTRFASASPGSTSSALSLAASLLRACEVSPHQPDSTVRCGGGGRGAWRRIGPWKIRKSIGRGGVNGNVWLRELFEAFLRRNAEKPSHGQPACLS